MARRKKISNDEPKGDEWLATFSDMVTLLLTFFVLLYSMSTVDDQKMKQISEAFKTMMNGKSGETLLEYDLYNGQVPLIGGESDIEEFIDTEQTTQEKMYNELKKFVEENSLEGVIDILESERGILIQMRDNILFGTASSSLRNESLVILDKISSLIQDLPNDILVEGHSDNRPINTPQFPSNWELSTDRAVNVVRYFVESKGLNPKRFSAAGYGEYQPVAPNDTDDNMAKNRRVNIVILANESE